MVFELDDVSKNGYYEPPLRFGRVECFVDEVIQLKKKMASYFENTNKDIT